MGTLNPTYDLKAGIFTVNGRRIRGAGETSMLTIVNDEDNYTKKTGGTGNATRSRTNNDGGTWTLTLNQNDVADIRFIEQEVNKPSPFDILSLAYVDTSTGEIIASEQAWLKKEADRNFNKESGDRVYVFDTANIARRQGV